MKKRWAIKYAWLPTRVQGRWVWLDCYWELEVYRWAGDGFYCWCSTFPEPTRDFLEP